MLSSIIFSSPHRAIRPPFDAIVDPLDQAEAARTTTVLRVGPGLLSVLILATRRPGRFLGALITLASLWRQAGGVVRHGAYLMEAAYLARLLSKHGSQHLHAHFGTNSATVALLTRSLGGPPFSFTVHGPEEFDRPERESLPLKIDGAAFVVAISSFGRSQLQRWCPYNQWQKIHVVRCGLDESFLQQAAAPVPDVAQMVCVGRLSEQKGHNVLLQATRQLIKEGCELKVICVGDGPLRRELERQIRRYDLSDAIDLVGWQTQTEIQAHLLASRCFVLPSFAEGLPVVLMEALAMGRPVISTYVAGIPELVEAGVNGWLVPAGNVERLAIAMRQALVTPADELTAMGLRGKERVAQQHSAAVEAAQLARQIEETT